MLSSYVYVLFLIVCACRLGCGQAFGNATYTNPILDQPGADPWVIGYEDHYLMTFTLNDNITIYRSQSLTNWNNAFTKLVFAPSRGEAYSYSLWAPDLHEIDERWYIIFTANADNEFPPPETDMLCDYTCLAVNHRMDNSTHTTNSQSTVPIFNTRPGSTTSTAAGTTNTLPGPPTYALQNYPTPGPSRPPSPNAPSSPCPPSPGRKTPYGRPSNDRLSSNEAPQQLTHPHNSSRTYIIYSAARSDNRNYCLGQLELVGQDPMNVNDWRKMTEGPVFYQNAAEGAYGVGHPSFTTSLDGREDWIVYHGMSDPLGGWGARTIRAQRFEWDDEHGDGEGKGKGKGGPRFPRPGYGPYRVPNGQV